MVDEQQVGSPLRPHRLTLTSKGPLPIVLGHPREQFDPGVVVAIGYEDRQRSFEVGSHDDGPSEVVALGVRVLTEHDHVVARPAPRPGEGSRVDVRARAPE